jgi:hypothetical protein
MGAAACVALAPVVVLFLCGYGMLPMVGVFEYVAMLGEEYLALWLLAALALSVAAIISSRRERRRAGDGTGRTPVPRYGMLGRQLGCFALAVVVAVVLSVLDLSTESRRLDRPETSVRCDLRTVHTAEVSFLAWGHYDANGDGTMDYGTMEQLCHVDPSSKSPPFLDWSSGKRDGYTFAITVIPGTTTQPPRFTCVAKPVKWGKTGDGAFFIDQTGIMHVTWDGSEPTVDSPVCDH